MCVRVRASVCVYELLCLCLMYNEIEMSVDHTNGLKGLPHAVRLNMMDGLSVC